MGATHLAVLVWRTDMRTFLNVVVCLLTNRVMLSEAVAALWRICVSLAGVIAGKLGQVHAVRDILLVQDKCNIGQRLEAVNGAQVSFNIRRRNVQCAEVLERQ